MRQEKRAYRIDDAQLQRALQLVFLLPGDGLDSIDLFQNGNRLFNDTPACRGNRDVMGPPFKDRHIKFIFQFFDSHTECRLAYEAGGRGPAEMQFTGDGDDVA